MDAHYGTLGILCAPFANAWCNGVSACPVVVPCVGCSCIHSSIEILMIQFNTISLHVIYTLHQQGDVPSAIEHYTSALATIPLNISKGGASNYENTMMVSTLLSNRAMCYLKLFEVQSTASTPEPKQLLLDCINDCTLALDHLETITSSDQSVNTARGKLLYRRAKALLATTTINSTSNATSNITDDTREQNLNSSAKDLLRLLQFNPNNKEAAALLRVVRAQHGSISGGMGRSRIAKVLGVLKSGDVDGGLHSLLGGEKLGGKEGMCSTLQCLRLLQGSLAEESASSAEEIGRGGGLPLLLQIARHGSVVAAAVPSTKKQSAAHDPQQMEQCRIASLHILSACCSYDSFILKYALRDSLPPQVLAQIVEEEAALSLSSSSSNDIARNTEGGSADVAVSAMALLVRLIVHWDHREVMRTFAPKIRDDGTLDASVPVAGEHVPEVDANSICRIAISALTWGSTNDNDGRAPRAALDLLSAWTASDLDALDAASDACFDSSPSTNSKQYTYTKAAHHRLTPEEMRQMKPRQVAAHRKREAEYQRNNLQRAIQHITVFCNEETGGLDSMLACAARATDHRLRREVGLQIGRMMSLFEEDDDVKKLITLALGCRDWNFGREEKDGEATSGLKSLTIEELDEEKEGGERKDCDSEEVILAMMKRGQLTASLLVGKPDVGTWALKYGWSNGNGLEELKQLISSNDPRAMSIASELVSAASSVESSRPLLASLVQEGTLDDLLTHSDADIRSGAASCAAKIGLASKALSEDEGEVLGLLDIAIELLFQEDNAESLGSSNVKTLSKIPSSKPSTESTSMDRGIEVMTYLASKTFVKERIANGYKPDGSPPNRETAIQRLVEIACAPKSGDAQMAFGLAGIFNLLSVSIETLQKEAFVGKDITKEQYDQLQSLGKTDEEKDVEAERGEREGDNPRAVSERIRKIANANVPRALVKLLEGSNSDATQEKLLEAMGRMASESSVRGIMIQQGCLSACLQLDKGVNTMDCCVLFAVPAQLILTQCLSVARNRTNQVKQKRRSYVKLGVALQSCSSLPIRVS